MPQGKLGPTLEQVTALPAQDRDLLRPMVEAVRQELLEAEMTEAPGAEKGERTPARRGHRSGCYGRTVTRVGKLEWRGPQDRHGRFSTELLERYQRSETALVAALAEMYVQGVSTRKACPRARPAGRGRSPRSSAATASRPRRAARSMPGSTRSWPSLPIADSTRPTPV